MPKLSFTLSSKKPIKIENYVDFKFNFNICAHLHMHEESIYGVSKLACVKKLYFFEKKDQFLIKKH